MNTKKLFFNWNKKTLAKFFRKNLKVLYVNKQFFIFFTIFLLANLFLLAQYVDALKSFALLEKNFTTIEANIVKTHPIDLLSNKFTCEVKQPIPGCYNYVYILFILFIFLEGFIIYSFIKNRKTIRKKILIGNSIFLQFLLILPLAVLVFSPYIAFNILGQQANKEIISSIQVLSNKDEITKRGIEQNLDTIRKNIEGKEDLQTLLEDNPKEQAILQILGITQNKKDSLYKVAVMPYQISWNSEISKKKGEIKFELLLFRDNTLIIQSVNQNLIEAIIPALANKIVRLKLSKYLGDVRISPIVNVPNEKEYLEIRKAEDEKIKIKFLNYINEIKNNIAYNQSALSENEQNIIDINREYDRYKAYGEGWLADCRRQLGAGHKDCIDGERKFNSELQALITGKQVSEENIKNIKFYISESRGYLFLAQKRYEDFLKNPSIPENEDGVFLPSNKIHLKYQFSKFYPISYYLATTIHEYLHFYSYNTSGTNTELPSFLEEGITDYLKLVIIDDYMRRQTQYLNYPNQIETVKLIIQIINEDKLKNIYFSKNENELSNLIDSNLSKGTYDQVKEKSNLLYALSTTNSKDKETQESLKKQIYNLLLNRGK